MSTQLEPANLTVADVAELIGTSTRTVKRYMATAGLPHYRIGGKLVRFRRSEVAEWLERSRSVHNVGVAA